MLAQTPKIGKIKQNLIMSQNMPAYGADLSKGWLRGQTVTHNCTQLLAQCDQHYYWICCTCVLLQHPALEFNN